MKLIAIICYLPLVSAGVRSVTLNNGNRMPVIAVGTAGYDNQTVVAATHNAIHSGFDHIHTAFNYYNLEGVAKAIKTAGTPRDKLFITSMTSACVHGPSAPARNVTDIDQCYELTTRELHHTIATLQLANVDLMMLHGPSDRYGSMGGCDKLVCELNAIQWRAYQEFYLAGKARAIGVSNFCQSCMECLLAASSTSLVPTVNQIQFHVGMGPDPEDLPSYCDTKGIVVQAYSPLASGEVVNDPDCARVADFHNKTAAQVGLAWVLQQTKNRTLVVKASKTTYLKQDVEALDLRLSQQELAALDAKDSPKGGSNGRPSWACTQ